MRVIRLSASQKRPAARVYARALFNDPVMIAHWPEASRRSRYLEWYLGCAINYGCCFGEVYTTPDIAGLAIWLPPGQTHFTTWRYIRSGFLLTPFVMGIRRSLTQAMRYEDLAQKAHTEIVPGLHWYLWGLAVDPEKQGKGIGSLLMQPGLQCADAQHLPCYLETHDPENIPFYLKHGFDLARTEKIPGSDLQFWSLLRGATAQ